MGHKAPLLQSARVSVPVLSQQAAGGSEPNRGLQQGEDMKTTRIHLIVAATILISVWVVAPVFAGLVNGSFESGDFTGWNLSAVWDKPPYPSYPYPPATIPIFDQVNVKSGNAADGGKFLLMDAVQVPEIYFTGPDGSKYLLTPGHKVILSQQFSASSGQVLSGWSKFSSMDYPNFADFAMVSVSQNSVTNTLWSFNLQQYYDWGNSSLDGFFLPSTSLFTPWYYWEWTVPESAVYELRLVLYGDDELHSLAGYDGIKLVNVPEPATVFSVLIGIFALTALTIALRKNHIEC